MYRQTQSLYKRISYRVLEQLQGHRRFVLVTPQRILLVQRELPHPGTITYRWERQAVTANPATDPWTTTGINSTTHSFSGTLSETTRFRRIAISELGGNNSCEASTGYVVVTLATPPVVNFVNTTTTTICLGDTVSLPRLEEQVLLTIISTLMQDQRLTVSQVPPQRQYSLIQWLMQVILWPTEIISG